MQYPVLQAQTTQAAMVKHRHALDTALLKHNLSVNFGIQILYSKPDSRASDTRSQSQPALAVFHTNFCEVAFSQSSAVLEGKLGPCPLVRVSEMQGFGEDEKPNPSARTEQQHGFIFMGFVYYKTSGRELPAAMQSSRVF